MPGKVSPEAAVVGGDWLFFCLEKKPKLVVGSEVVFCHLSRCVCVKKNLTGGSFRGCKCSEF